MLHVLRAKQMWKLFNDFSFFHETYFAVLWKQLDFIFYVM